MIKFVHKNKADSLKGTQNIIITYSVSEIILGFILLVTNITAMIMIYEFTYYYRLGAFDQNVSVESVGR